MFLFLIPGGKGDRCKLFQLGIKLDKNTPSQIRELEIKIQKHSTDISVDLLFSLYILAIIVAASVINILTADLFKYSARLFKGREFRRKTL